MVRRMKTPLHIIIDGPDNTGKTTVCQLLSKMTGLPVVKMPNMKEYIQNHSTEEFSKLFNETLVQFKRYDFILDRGFTSSLAYSQVHERSFDLSYVDQIEKELDPSVFIMTGHVVDDEFKYFDVDEIFSEKDTIAVDKAFMDLAEKRKYYLIAVNGRSPKEIVTEIMEQL